MWNTDTAKSYGFIKSGSIEDEARRRKSSDYAEAMADEWMINVWWLRSPGYISNSAMSVYYGGRVDYDGDSVNSDSSGICPALNLNLSSSNFYTYAGTVCSDGTTVEADGDPEKPGGEKPNPETPVQENPEIPGTKPPVTPDSPEKPSVGSELTDDSGKAVCKVMGTETVQYSKIVNKKAVSVKIPDKVTLNGKTYKVTSVGKGAFQNCKKLKSVVIGKNVASIGAKAFSGCKALKKITIKSAKLKKVGKNAFKGIYAKASVKAPKAKRKAYQKLLRAGGAGSKVRIK